MVVTSIQAKEMRDAIQLLGQAEAQQTKIEFDANMVIAQTWYNTIKKPVPTTRQGALNKFNHIKELLETETNQFRLTLLRTKLQESNEKYKEIKKLG